MPTRNPQKNPPRKPKMLRRYRKIAAFSSGFFKNPPFTNGETSAIIAWLSSRCTGGSMDRASDSGSEGWGFESLPVCQKEVVLTDGLFLAHRKGLEQSNTTVRWTVARCGLDRTDTMSSAPLGQNCNESLPVCVDLQAAIISQLACSANNSHCRKKSLDVP